MTMPRTLTEQRELCASAVKDPYATRFAILPTKVKTVEYDWFGGGRYDDKWIWLASYNVYLGEKLHKDFVFHLKLPEGTWYPGVESHPFVSV